MKPIGLLLLKDSMTASLFEYSDIYMYMYNVSDV